MFEQHEKTIFIFLAAGLILGAAFWGGMKYQASREGFTVAPDSASGGVQPGQPIIPAGGSSEEGVTGATETSTVIKPEHPAPILPPNAPEPASKVQ